MSKEIKYVDEDDIRYYSNIIKTELNSKVSVSAFNSLSSTVDKKVDKVTGKDLSTNDFTDELKTKLEGIEEGAEVNVQSDYEQNDSTKDDYINNRPCYKIPGDGSSITIIDEDLEYTYQAIYTGASTYMPTVTITSDELPAIGVSGTITVGDRTYTGTWYEEYDTICLGKSWDDIETDNEFIQICYNTVKSGGSYEGYIMNARNDLDLVPGQTLTMSTKVTKVSSDTYIKLDDNYLNIEEFGDLKILNIWNNATPINN